VKKFLFLLVFCASGCSYFFPQEDVVVVGSIRFSKEYFSKRFVEKLKNLDGLHVKDLAVTQSFSAALTQELIVEGYLYSWASRNGLQFGRDEIARFLNEYLASSEGVSNDFLFEAQTSKNLLEDSVKVQLIKARLFAYLEKSVVVTDAEVEKFHKERPNAFNERRIHLAQIFLEKEADAEMILKALRGKGKFEDLAKKYSLSPEGQSGGDIGWVTAEGMPYIEPLFNAPLGVSLKIFKSPQGYHVYKVLGFRKSTNQPLSQVKDKIINAIKTKKLEEAYLLWLQEQVKNVKVKTNEGLIQSLNPSYQETL